MRTCKGLKGLDKVLADIYDVPLKAFNQQVKRNIEENFMFQLDELDELDEYEFTEWKMIGYIKYLEMEKKRTLAMK